MNPHLVYAVLNILAAVAAAALILSNVRCRRSAKHWEAVSKVVYVKAYKQGVQAEQYRRGQPIEEREKQAYIQGLKDAREALAEPQNLKQRQ